MMNIGIFCKTLLKGGTEKQALILSKLLTEQNNNVTLIIWSNQIDPENMGFIKSNSLNLILLEGNCLKKFIQYNRILKEKKFEFVLSYLTLPNVISGLSRLFVSNLIRIGGIRNERLPYHKFVFERWIHNYFNDCTVFNNYSAREKFIGRGFRADKIYVIQNAISTLKLNGSAKRDSSDIRIVTVSRFVKQKDFRTALYSFSELVNNNTDKRFSYYLIGYGKGEKKIRAITSALKLQDRIKLLINPAGIKDILRDCDIYLSTSLFEGLSNSIMEAMAAGLPVIATDVGDNSYLVKDGFNGYLTPCKDVTMIADKLSVLARSENLRIDFGKRSRTLIESKFSQENLLNEYLNLFSKLQVSLN
jgi:glycosyltransferase involved in cell wall biosynthesis